MLKVTPSWGWKFPPHGTPPFRRSNERSKGKTAVSEITIVSLELGVFLDSMTSKATMKKVKNVLDRSTDKLYRYRSSNLILFRMSMIEISTIANWYSNSMPSFFREKN